MPVESAIHPALRNTWSHVLSGAPVRDISVGIYRFRERGGRRMTWSMWVAVVVVVISLAGLVSACGYSAWATTPPAVDISQSSRTRGRRWWRDAGGSGRDGNPLRRLGPRGRTIRCRRRRPNPLDRRRRTQFVHHRLHPLSDRRRTLRRERTRQSDVGAAPQPRPLLPVAARTSAATVRWLMRSPALARSITWPRIASDTWDLESR
jgi:hypothetical protein